MPNSVCNIFASAIILTSRSRPAKGRPRINHDILVLLINQPNEQNTDQCKREGVKIHNFIFRLCTCISSLCRQGGGSFKPKGLFCRDPWKNYRKTFMGKLLSINIGKFQGLTWQVCDLWQACEWEEHMKGFLNIYFRFCKTLHYR